MNNATPAASPMQPSDWVTRWSHLLQPGSTALDLACGSGRHTRWLSTRGVAVTAIDRDAEAVEPLRSLATVLVADLETGPWPLPDCRFDLVLITNYLWRPLWPAVLAAVKPGGVLLYETFARGNETVGRPSRTHFLLEPGELLVVCQGWRVLGYEDGYVPGPPRFIQRIVALKPGGDRGLPPALPSGSGRPAPG